MKQYLDLSIYQKDVDYTEASKGLDGVILRAGFGKGNEDKMFRTHYEGFRACGVPVGVYWFSYASNPEEAANEAQYCISVIHGLEIELPVCFDFEDDSVKYAKSKGVKITKPLATAIAEAFLSTIERNGYYAMLYANPNFLDYYYNDLSKYDLWLAVWPKKVDTNNPPRLCGIWQYGVGNHPGIEGEVDLDVAYKDYPKLIRDSGLNHLSPITEPKFDRKIEWGLGAGLVIEAKLDSSVTCADVIRILYDYHYTFNVGDDDTNRPSGLLADEE